MTIEQQIKELEARKDSINEQFLSKWGKLGILEFVRLRREREAIQQELDQLYQKLD